MTNEFGTSTGNPVAVSIARATEMEKNETAPDKEQATTVRAHMYFQLDSSKCIKFIIWALVWALMIIPSFYLFIVGMHVLPLATLAFGLASLRCGWSRVMDYTFGFDSMEKVHVEKMKIQQAGMDDRLARQQEAMAHLEALRSKTTPRLLARKTTYGVWVLVGTLIVVMCFQVQNISRISTSSSYFVTPLNKQITSARRQQELREVPQYLPPKQQKKTVMTYDF